MRKFLLHCRLHAPVELLFRKDGVFFVFSFVVGATEQVDVFEAAPELLLVPVFLVYVKVDTHARTRPSCRKGDLQGGEALPA